MATISEPQILAYQLGVAASGTSNRFVPASGEAWEVHSIVVSRAATVIRDFDPTGNGSWPVAVEHDNIGAAGEFHCYKWELGANCGIRVRNDSAQGTMNVVLLGIRWS